MEQHAGAGGGDFGVKGTEELQGLGVEGAVKTNRGDLPHALLGAAAIGDELRLHRRDHHGSVEAADLQDILGPVALGGKDDGAQMPEELASGGAAVVVEGVLGGFDDEVGGGLHGADEDVANEVAKGGEEVSGVIFMSSLCS